MQKITERLYNRLRELKEQEQLPKKTIDRLKEYCSALITAAVTGQVDVRGWRAPETSAP